MRPIRNCNRPILPYLSVYRVHSIYKCRYFSCWCMRSFRRKLERRTNVENTKLMTIEFKRSFVSIAFKYIQLFAYYGVQSGHLSFVRSAQLGYDGMKIPVSAQLNVRWWKLPIYFHYILLIVVFSNCGKCPVGTDSIRNELDCSKLDYLDIWARMFVGQHKCGEQLLTEN